MTFLNQLLTKALTSFYFRRIYPVIILTKGPLGWNWEYIRNNSVKVFTLATLPWIVECLSTAFFTHVLLDYPWYWGMLIFMLNFLVNQKSKYIHIFVSRSRIIYVYINKLCSMHIVSEILFAQINGIS